MKKFYSLRSAALSLAVAMTAGASAAVPQTPDVEGFINYTGSTFDVYWSPISDASSYLLNVFSKTGDVRETTTTFNSLNAPEHWEYVSSGMHTAPDGNYILLKNNGDGVFYFNPNGVLEDFVISGLSIGFNEDNVTEDNSCIIKIDIYNNSGYAWYHASVAGHAFSVLPTMSLKECLSFWPDNIVGVRISIERDDNRPYGEVALKTATTSAYDRDYLVEDYETEDFLLTVEGADPEEVYYYYVAAKNDDGLSAASEIIKVDGMLPVTQMSHSNVGNTYYTAQWEAVPKAQVYYINHYKLIPQSSTDGYVTIFQDTFANSTQGSREEPVSVESLDGITDNAGWGGATLIAAPGMIGAGSGRYGSANLDTPRFDASDNDGIFQVHVKAYGTAGDKLNIINQGKYKYVNGVPTGIMETLVFDDNGEIDGMVELDMGDATTFVTFEESASRGLQNPFLLDNVRITTEAAEGENFEKRYIERRYTEGRENTSYTFTGLEPGGMYGFEVQTAKLDDKGEEVQSSVSALHTVTLLTEAAVQLPDADGTIAWNGSSLEANLSVETLAVVYDMSGRKVASKLLPAGSSVTDFSLSKGFYIVRVAQHAYKISVK